MAGWPLTPALPAAYGPGVVAAAHAREPGSCPGTFGRVPRRPCLVIGSPAVHSENPEGTNMAVPITGTRNGSARTVSLVLLIVASLVGCGSNPSPTASPSATAQAGTTPSPAPSATASAGADLAVWSTHDGPPVKGTVAYHVHYANLSLGDPAHAVVLTIKPPDGATLASLSRDSQPSAAGGVDILLGTVDPGASGVVDAQVAWADAPALGAWTALSTRISAAGPDPDATNNTATDGERVPTPNLALTMRLADASGALVPGSTVAYLLSYANVASGDAASPSIALKLPKGLTYVNASGSFAGKPSTTAEGEGTLVTIPLRAVKARATGSAEVRVALAADLAPGQSMTSSALISADADTVAADNQATSTDVVQAAGADLWVALDSKGATDVGGKHVYRVRYGNRGTAAAENVALSAVIPSALSNVRYSIQPTSVAGGTATWDIAALPKATGVRAIEITATVAAAGSASVSAQIASTTADTNAGNGTAEATVDLVAIAMPVIIGPVNAVVGTRPVVFGTGRIGATVSLYLAGASDGASQPLGTAKVDGNGSWEIQPAADLPEAGWHWFTATQQLGDLVSELAGVAAYTSADAEIDTNSLTVNGKRLGGIDQVISWPTGATMTFGAKITACAKPISPMLRADYYSAADVVVNRLFAKPARASDDGSVEFAFTVPRVSQEVTWQMLLVFYCADTGQSQLESGWRTVLYTAGLLDTAKKKLKCLLGMCPPPPPPPPPPPKPCPGCTPFKPPKKPAPNFMSEPEEKWSVTGSPTAALTVRRLG